MDARKNNGTKYQLSSAKAIRFALNRNSTQKFDIDIVKDPVFKKAMTCFMQ
jgi:hypothetical protein